MGEVFYEDFIKKLELKDRWVQLWARLIGQKLYFYVSKDCKEVDFCEIIWLSSCSKCTLLKRRNYSFRFRLTTNEGSYYLKCDSNLQRHRWIHMIHLACSGRSMELPPNHINMRCCYRDGEPNEIGNGRDIKQSPSRENNNEERAPEMSDGKETSGEDEVSKGFSRGGSSEELRSSKQIINENDRSTASEESVNQEKMTTNSERTCKESEIETKEEKQPREMANDKTITAANSSEEPSAARQTFSFKTFTFGSLRKSLRRQSYPPKRNKELPQSIKDQRNSDSYANFEEKIKLKYSMDNPAFTDDDSVDNVKENTYMESYPKTKIINVVSRKD